MRQRDQDFSVGHAGGGAVAERHGVGAVRQTDVIEHQVDLLLGDDFPDCALHLAEVTLGLLDARPGRSSHVQTELSGIDGWKEVSSYPRHDHCNPLATMTANTTKTLLRCRRFHCNSEA